MKWEKLRTNLGWQMRLVPPVIHLDAEGDPLPSQDEDWIIQSSADDYLVISATSGFTYRLGKDHIKSFASDHDRTLGTANFGLLTLVVQLYTQGNRMWHVTTPQPGMVVPPLADKAARARVHFTPELERAFRRQVQILDRAIANFGQTSMGRGSCPGDTWQGLLPKLPTLYPHSPAYHDLSSADARVLAEFYGAVQEVHDTLTLWIGVQPLTDPNAWNYLMHKTEHCLRIGEVAVERFAPDRQFDATMPATGTLLSRSRRSLETAARVRAAHIARHSKGRT